jgi:hypothetical protein
MPKSRMRKCHDGKVAFDTLEQAKAAASGMARRKATQGNPVVTYLRAYGKFHFGRTREINWDLVSEITKRPHGSTS